MVLVLPYPVSANELWRSYVPKGWKRASVYSTHEAKAWKRNVEKTCMACGLRDPLQGPLAVRLVHHHRAYVLEGKRKDQRNGHVYDLDNVLKVTLDGLKGCVYVDDRQIKRILIEYGRPTREGHVVVHVEKFIEGVQESLPSGYWVPSTQDHGGLPF